MSRPSLDPILQQHYGEHSGGSGKVILATVHYPDGEDKTGIFSSLEKAESWRDQLGAEFGEDLGALFVPMIVDDPDFGNRKVG